MEQSKIIDTTETYQMGEVLCNGFDLAVLNLSDRRGHDMYCIVAIKGKKMGFTHA